MIMWTMATLSSKTTTWSGVSCRGCYGYINVKGSSRFISLMQVWATCLRVCQVIQNAVQNCSAGYIRINQPETKWSQTRHCLGALLYASFKSMTKARTYVTCRCTAFHQTWTWTLTNVLQMKRPALIHVDTVRYCFSHDNIAVVFL